MISRREILAATAAGVVMSASTARAASFGNPDEPPQGAINAKNPASITDPGPQNQAVAGQFPSAVNPPATDVGSLQMNWASFNNAPRRIQNGGWAREVTQATFPISDTISGVNMRLTAGGIRELHWHQAAEWAFMSATRSCSFSLCSGRRSMKKCPCPIGSGIRRRRWSPST
jgi:oxalate decarboxylase